MDSTNTAIQTAIGRALTSMGEGLVILHPQFSAVLLSLSAFFLDQQGEELGKLLAPAFAELDPEGTWIPADIRSQLLARIDPDFRLAPESAPLTQAQNLAVARLLNTPTTGEKEEQA